MFAFLHTADWQIGRPFSRFPTEVASALVNARLDVIERLGETALKAGVRDILVAGDVFEAEVVSNTTLRQPLAIMQRYERLVWHLLPGNHDLARTGGIWERVAALSAPQNVRVYVQPGPHEIADGVSLLAAPLAAKVSSDDPTAWMDDAATGDGVIRVGLAHGAIARFGSDASASVPIDPARAKTAGLDYLALGDDHGTKRIGERTWYSGTPEPDGWKENDPGNALVVRLEGPGAAPSVEKIRTATFTWLERSLAITDRSDLDAFQRNLLKEAANPRNFLLRLHLEGRVSLSTLEEIEHALDGLTAQLRHIECVREGLDLEAVDEDFERFANAGELAKVALRIKESLTTGSDDEREIAGIALLRLYGLAGREDAT